MSGGSQQTSSNNGVASWLQPSYTNAVQDANNLYSSGGPKYYSGQQVANLSPMQNTGLSDISNAASDPSAASMAQQQNRNIESGAYLNPASNPYLSGTFNTAAQGVQNNIDSQFGAAGRNVVSSAPVQSSAMNQLANEIYGGAYQSGMQNMVQSQYAAPALDSATYMPGQQMMQAGSTVQNQNQAQIDALMKQYNYNQQLPYNNLSFLTSELGSLGAPFGTNNSTTTSTPSAMSQILGGGLAAASLFGTGGAVPGLSSLFAGANPVTGPGNIPSYSFGPG